MFTVNEEQRDGFRIIRMKGSNGSYAEILPEQGAILHAFGFENGGDLQNVVDQYNSADDFKNQVEQKGFIGTKLTPFVCRLNKGEYRLHEKNYKVEKFYLNGHAIHGLLYDAVYEVVSTSANEKEAVVVLRHHYLATDAGYPFAFTCEVKYRLADDAALQLITNITNNSQEVIPVSDGWHPYFKIGDNINELLLRFKYSNQVEFDEDLLPNGNVVPYNEFAELQPIGDISLDNCFTADFAREQPLISLQKPGVGAVDIHPSTSYRFIQIYTPPHRRSIAIENLSSAPDAFNNGIGLIYLLPGEMETFETTYQIRKF